MRDTETYKEFANECERIARTMTGEHRKSLLTIAEACASSRGKRNGGPSHAAALRTDGMLSTLITVAARAAAVRAIWLSRQLGEYREKEQAEMERRSCRCAPKW
jgi:hypothetical protein